MQTRTDEFYSFFFPFPSKFLQFNCENVRKTPTRIFSLVLSFFRPRPETSALDWPSAANTFHVSSRVLHMQWTHDVWRARDQTPIYNTKYEPYFVVVVVVPRPRIFSVTAQILPSSREFQPTRVHISYVFILSVETHSIFAVYARGGAVVVRDEKKRTVRWRPFSRPVTIP